MVKYSVGTYRTTCPPLGPCSTSTPASCFSVSTITHSVCILYALRATRIYIHLTYTFGVRTAPADTAVTPFESKPRLLNERKPGHGAHRRRSHREEARKQLPVGEKYSRRERWRWASEPRTREWRSNGRVSGMGTRARGRLIGWTQAEG